MRRWVDRVALGVGAAAGWAFPVIALLMGWEVIARYVFGAPTFWAHEIAGLIAGVAFIFGGAYCMADRSHMRVTLLIDRMRPRPRWAVELLSLICGTIFLVGLVVAMWGIVDKSLLKFAVDGTWTPERSGSTWSTPAPAYLKTALLIGAALFLAVVLRRAIGLLRGDAPDAPDGPER